MSKILLVDDDIDLTELLSEVLTMEGFESYITYNGQEALDVLAKEHFDMVLLDVMMPVLNGIETLKRIRAKYDIPVLMLSARDDEIDRVLGLELGADDYLPKPFNDRELIARIKAILRRSVISASKVLETSNEQEEQSTIIVFDSIELHPKQQQATYKGNSLELTGTEYALLESLVTHAGQIVPREKLSSEILGKELTPYDRAIDMHMSNLRKKLPERTNDLPWFKTLRGRGYLLVSEV